MAPKSRLPTSLLVIGAGAAGVTAFLIYRSVSQAATTGSSAFTSGLPPGVNVTVPRSASSSEGMGPAIPSSVASRIAGSEQARQAFAVQALIYSFHTSDQAPDGQVSTVNSELDDLHAISAGAVGSRLSGSSLAEVRQYLFGQDPGRVLRALPYTMPQALIDQINASSASVDSQYIALQALAQPAGAALAPAG